MGKRVIIGVTGGYASGKTTVTDMLVERGAFRIDADEITHYLLREDEGIRNRIIEVFGTEVLSDNGVDRSKLAAKVFFDRNKLEVLTGILHPRIIRDIQEKVEEIREGVVVIDAPLLIEAGLDEYVDIVVVVTAAREKQIERGKSRGRSADEVEKIIDSQLPIADKLKAADHIINTNLDISETKEGVDKIWQEV